MQLKKHSRFQVTEEKVNAKQFLTFIIGLEEYGIEICYVQEIKGFTNQMDIVKISAAPPHIVGLIYLQNFVIPVVDLNIFYHHKTSYKHGYNVIIILNVSNRCIGLVVDNVLDIINLAQKNIQPSPEFFSIISRDYIEGIGKQDNHVIQILNIKKLIENEDLKLKKIPAT